MIQKQVLELIKNPPDCVTYVLNELDILDIQADVHGPVGTPYYGGKFRCKLVLSSEFPKVPPKGYFITKIFHPNISEKGEICVNTLKKDWNPTSWSLSAIFEVIRCLLIVPFPESALNEEAGKMFMEEYEEYAKHAKLITGLYAMPKEITLLHGPSSPKKESHIEIPMIGSSPFKSGGQNAFSEEPQFTKENLSNENPNLGLKLEKGSSAQMNLNSNPEEVLTTVTNSLKNSDPNSVNLLYKKSNSMINNPSGMGLGGITPTSNTTMTSQSAKKENEKKAWMKRI